MKTLDKSTPYYIASPYSHADAMMRKWRLDRVCDVTRTLIQMGIPALSPIAHNATALGEGAESLDSDFWRIQNEALMMACKKLIIVTLPGWDSSAGITAKIAFCKERGFPIYQTDWFDSPAQAAALIVALVK